jgi:hypothetical protein
VEEGKTKGSVMYEVFVLHIGSKVNGSSDLNHTVDVPRKRTFDWLLKYAIYGFVNGLGLRIE